jgi:hypothetical protein
MRRIFGAIALLAALAGGQAVAQQQDQQQLQQQQDRQQRDVEEGRQTIQNPYRQEYRTMAVEARRNAEQAQDPADKEKWLKLAKAWERLAR